MRKCPEGSLCTIVRAVRIRGAMVSVWTFVDVSCEFGHSGEFGQSLASSCCGGDVGSARY